MMECIALLSGFTFASVLLCGFQPISRYIFFVNRLIQAEVAALARRLAKVNDLSGVSAKFGLLQQQPNMRQQQQQQQQSLEQAYKPRQFQ
jgi:hypothetical protein